MESSTEGTSTYMAAMLYFLYLPGTHSSTQDVSFKAVLSLVYH